MADYGASDTSTTTIGANQFPISDVYVPNTGLRATEGGPVSTDAGGKASAPTSMYIKDGGNVTQGAQADAAYTDGTGAASGTGMGLFKGIFVKLAAIATAIVSVLKVKGDFTEVAGQGTGVVTGVGTFLLPETDVSAYKHFSMTLSGTWTMTLIVEVSNTSGANYQTLIVQQPNPSIANFSSITANGTYDAPLKWRYLRIRVSAFTSNASLASTFEFHTLPGALEAINAVQVGTWTVQPGNTANTTAWLVNQATSATGTKTSVASSASSVTILASNASRKGAMIYNDSTQVLYLDLSGGTASNASYSVQIQPNGFFELPPPAIYSGLITGIWAAANGNCRVTEFS